MDQNNVPAKVDQVENVENPNNLPRPGFERGLEPDFIVGAVENSLHQLMFLVKWKGTDEADLINSADMYREYPQVAISFFESRLVYHNTPVPSPTHETDHETDPVVPENPSTPESLSNAESTSENDSEESGTE